MFYGIDADKGYIVERLTEKFVDCKTKPNLDALLAFMTYIKDTVKEEYKQYWCDKMDFYSNLLTK